jgi:cytochrome c553
MIPLRKFQAWCLAASAVLGATAASADDIDLPEGPGRAATVAACTQCHGIDLFAQPRSPDEWSQVVTLMIGNGMAISDDEYRLIMDYLSTSLAPAAEQQEPAEG